MSPQKQALKAYLDAFKHPGKLQDSATRAFFAHDAQINVAHPFNEISGAEGFIEHFLNPLRQAFQGLYRRDYIAMGGTFEGQEWVTCTGHYVGHFGNPWIGIKPTGMLTWLRVGEFHRIENGQAVESYVYLDIPELMIATGQWPIVESPGVDRGYVGMLPGPASQDGLQWHENDPAVGHNSISFTTDMLRALATEDEAWRPYWHDNMMWYGPAAFGAFVGIDNFAGFQVPFENAFEGWSGGASNNGLTRHFTRCGDGNYTCTGGWPSLTGVQIGRFLGREPENKRVFMRVCDWWRIEDGLFVENWVFVDILHVLLQLGHDVLSDLKTKNG